MLLFRLLLLLEDGLLLFLLLLLETDGLLLLLLLLLETDGVLLLFELLRWTAGLLLLLLLCTAGLLLLLCTADPRSWLVRVVTVFVELLLGVDVARTAFALLLLVETLVLDTLVGAVVRLTPSRPLTSPVRLVLVLLLAVRV